MRVGRAHLRAADTDLRTVWIELGSTERHGVEPWSTSGLGSPLELLESGVSQEIGWRLIGVLLVPGGLV
jgi:hypothetical protein